MKSYWQGNTPIRTSFWLVFIGLLIVIHFLEPLYLKSFFSDPQQRITATFISLAITKLLLYPWQLIGLLRASDKDFLLNGNTLKTRVIQLLLLLSVAYILSYSIGLIQSATHEKQLQKLASEYQDFKQQDKNYKLTLRNNSTQLVITGEFEIGITDAVKQILKTNPQISSIALNSIGGHIYEGRGLSKLFTRQSLSTYVYKECSSACTTAFGGGVKRYLGSSAKLGFHQYKQDFSVHKKSVGYHDATAEQERDLELFQSRGISENFLTKIYNEKADSMWFPDHKTLIEANVIDDVVEDAKTSKTSVYK